MMPFFTAAVLAAFVGYAGAWYFELVEGNFALLLFSATIVTGLYWVAERLFYLPRRRREAAEMEERATQRNARLSQQGVAAVDPHVAEAKQKILAQPWWLDWTCCARSCSSRSRSPRAR
jgi:signal peptidase I